MDADNHERERKLTEIEQDLANERAENKRLQSLVENRENEIAKSQSENRQLKSQIEALKRTAAEAQRISQSEESKFKNRIASIQATFEMEISNSKIELEKWKLGYRKINDDLNKEKKNSEKRSKMAEEAEVTATEKINEVKTENWAIIEKLRSEKRETDSLYQKEVSLIVHSYSLIHKTCDMFGFFGSVDYLGWVLYLYIRFMYLITVFIFVRIMWCLEITILAEIVITVYIPWY